MEETSQRACSTTTSSLLGSILLVLSSCAANPTALNIVKDVKPLNAIKISRICIELSSKDASAVAMSNDLFDAIEALGFNTLAKQASFAGECQYSLTYKVSWAGFPKWPLAVDVMVYDGRKQIGYIQYDASRGSSRPDRYGSAIGKIKPLLNELFAEVVR
ncbi:MAG: hypothetical protein O7F71_04580 [Gammaproteobacteria bacterium]|nr:hypothetical protein [Gammaproteobacteria bacterium]